MHLPPNPPPERSFAKIRFGLILIATAGAFFGFFVSSNSGSLRVDASDKTEGDRLLYSLLKEREKFQQELQPEKEEIKSDRSSEIPQEIDEFPQEIFATLKPVPRLDLSETSPLNLSEIRGDRRTDVSPVDENKEADIPPPPPFERGEHEEELSDVTDGLAADVVTDVTDGLSAGDRVLPVPETGVQAALSSEFLNRVLGCVNLYEIEPADESLVGELRQLRLELAAFWMGAPPEGLETIYRGEMRQAYRALLASGFQNEALTEEEEGFLQHLTEVSTGLSQPKAVNALLGAMLYFPAGKMRVRDAASRLPHWLLGDYEAVFENPIENPPQPPFGRGGQEENLPQPKEQEKEVVPVGEKFVNEVLGSVHLYYIDPSDESAIARLRQLRRQMADLCLKLPAEELEGFYRGEMGKGFRALLGSGFQNEPMLEHEVAFLQEVAIALAKGIEAPKALNHLLAAMLYCRRGQLQVEDTSKLPQWFVEDYEKFASGESPLVVAG